MQALAQSSWQLTNKQFCAESVGGCGAKHKLGDYTIERARETDPSRFVSPIRPFIPEAPENAWGTSGESGIRLKCLGARRAILPATRLGGIQREISCLMKSATKEGA